MRKKFNLVALILTTGCVLIVLIQRNVIHDFDLKDLQFPSTSKRVNHSGQDFYDEDEGGEEAGVWLTAAEQKEAREFCAVEHRGNSKQAISLVEVEPNPPKRKPSILCYVQTISSFKEKSDAVRNTWGPRCDKLVFISNETLADTVDIPLVAYDHAHLWDKTRKSFQYLWQHHPNFDWYYKADDDTYIVMENLRTYLANQSLEEPLLFGHRFMFPEAYAKAYAKNLYADFRAKFGPWIYTSGGSGYAINRILLQSMVHNLNQTFCFPQQLTVPEDAAASFCARYSGGYVPPTRDRMHKQRFHALNPAMTFHQDRTFKETDWWYKYHEGTGGVQGLDLSISKESVAFHYNNPDLMYYIDAQLYACRRYPNRTVSIWFHDMLRNSEWMKVYDPSRWSERQAELEALKKTGIHQQNIGEVTNGTVSDPAHDRSVRQ